MGESGRQLAAEMYSWPAIARELMDIYRDLAHAPAGAWKAGTRTAALANAAESLANTRAEQ